jgi:hypothetical protein
MRWHVAKILLIDEDGDPGDRLRIHLERSGFRVRCLDRTDVVVAAEAAVDTVFVVGRESTRPTFIIALMRALGPWHV